jgi:hypothetical protein
MTMISASEAIHETEMTDWMTIDPQVVSKLLYIDTSCIHNLPAAILTRSRHKTIDRTPKWRLLNLLSLDCPPRVTYCSRPKQRRVGLAYIGLPAMSFDY